MIIKNEEYNILIRAPQGNSNLCLYLPAGTCNNQSEFDLHFTNDLGKTIKSFYDICSRHLVIAIIEGISK